MSFRVNADTPTDVCGTFYAAKVLGVAVATVQGLVERGELEAWKTKGGHRRISMSSLRAYIDKNGTRSTQPLAGGSSNLRVLIVDDDEVTLEVIRSSMERWNLPLDCTVMNSAIDAMLDIAKIKPDLLISDLNIPVVDGFEFLRRLRSNPEFADMAFLVITGMSQEQIDAKGGVPEGTPVISKPLDMVWLNGFLAAMSYLKTLHWSPRGASFSVGGMLQGAPR
jgi:excisionase family DNA binding protein